MADDGKSLDDIHRRIVEILDRPLPIVFGYLPGGTTPGDDVYRDRDLQLERDRLWRERGRD
jgi:hypothetical protein